MTRPTTVRPRPSTNWATAMQMPDYSDGPAGADFIAWAEEHGLQPRAEEQNGHRRLTLTSSDGLTRPIEPHTWVIVHRYTNEPEVIETCTPEYFAATYEQARPLIIETYTTGAGCEHRWRARHRTNGEIIATGESYTDRRALEQAIQVLWPDLLSYTVHP